MTINVNNNVSDASLTCAVREKSLIPKNLRYSFSNAHTILAPPLLVRSAKLSRIGPSQVRKWETIAKRKVVLLFAQRRSFAACCSALLAAAAHVAHQNCSSSSSTAHISFDLDSLRMLRSLFHVEFSQFFPKREKRCCSCCR